MEGEIWNPHILSEVRGNGLFPVVDKLGQDIVFLGWADRINQFKRFLFFQSYWHRYREEMHTSRARVREYTTWFVRRWLYANMFFPWVTCLRAFFNRAYSCSRYLRAALELGNLSFP